MIDLRSAFLRDILENPADDTPRLVFADWLEDNGEIKRAEFIRGQCELARCRALWPEDWEERYTHLLRRERELLDWLCAEDPSSEFGFPPHETWYPSGTDGDLICPALGASASFCRGFITKITLALADFLTHAEALFSVQPITTVRLTDRGPIDNYTWGRVACVAYGRTLAGLPALGVEK